MVGFGPIGRWSMRRMPGPLERIVEERLTDAGSTLRLIAEQARVHAPTPVPLARKSPNQPRSSVHRRTSAKPHERSSAAAPSAVYL